MRTTKFRVWDKEKKMMRYSGFEVNLRNSTVCSVSILGDDYEYTRVLFTGAPAGEYPGAPIDPEDAILMQSTNLFDKNNKEIFDGDVVRAKYYDHEDGESYQVTKVLVFDEKHGQYVLKDNINDVFYKPAFYSHNVRNSIKIIGDIYTTPELLKP